MINKIKKKQIICIIPARSKSKRIINKNIKLFFGKPLISHSLLIAKKSKLFKNIYVSTDSKKIKKISEKNGAEVPFLRDKKLSGDHTSTKDVLIDFIKKIENENIDIIFCLYPTAPLLLIKDLKLALKEFLKKKADCLLPIAKHRSSPLRSIKLNKNNKVEFFFSKFQKYRSQDLKELYFDTGTFYIFKKDVLLKKKFDVFPKNTVPFLIDSLRSVDINEYKDLEDAKIIYKFLFKKK